MALKVIGAGFGRTGTDSLKRALEMLGFAPCYHMYEVIPHAERYQLWQDIYDGATPNWDAVFDGFQASVDWPAAFFWRALAAHFPDAKIILTVRDPESWHRSMEKTILPAMRKAGAPGLAARLARNVFDGRLDDKAHVIGAYERNIAEVQAAFGDDRLLTYELGSGWEPLCEFLGCQVPETPYPSGNAQADYHAAMGRLSKARTSQG